MPYAALRLPAPQPPTRTALGDEDGYPGGETIEIRDLYGKALATVYDLVHWEGIARETRGELES